jgi:carbon-monoxide dehydrogenase medium subunit
VLTGARITPALLSEAGEILLTEASPVDDIRASAEYRKRLLPKLLERAVVACAETIQKQERGTKQ